MDPSGPWAYTYNRIAVTGVSSPSSTTASSDYQQQQNLTTSIAGQTVVSGASPTSSAILLQTSNPSDVGSSGSSFNSGGYITSTPVSYDQVFNPIFQHSGSKPAHYNSSINSHRQNLGSVQIVGATEKSESPQQNFSNHGQQHQQNFYAEQSSAASPSPSTSLVSTWRSGNVSHISVADPFSILSQDSVVQATSPASSGQQNNYGTQYQTQQSQLNQLKVSTRSSSPQVVGGAKTTIQSVPSPIAAVTVASSSMQTPTQYYRQSSNIATSYSDSSVQTGNVVNSSKSFSTVNPSPLNQTCILVTTSPAGQGVSAQNVSTQKYAKKQNMYNNATRNSAGKSGGVIGQQNLVITNNGNNFNSPTTSVKPNNHTLQLVQTKAQSKIYNEIVFVDEQDRAKFAEIHQAEGSDGTVSYYTILDGRLTYATSGNANLIINESPKGRTMSDIQSPRQFVLSNTAGIVASDGSTIKTEPDYSVSALQSECATSTIIVPRKQSPSHSASSQAPSPAYPIYNSPMNSIESPSQHSASSGATHSSSENSGHIVIYKSNNPNQAQIATQSALDNSSNSRVTANNTLTNPSGPVVYSSVITRALVNEPGKVYSPQQTCWDNDVKPKKYFTINSGVQNEIVVPAEIQLKPAYYDPSVNSSQLGALHGLKTEETQVTENILVTSDNPLSSQIQITQKLEEPPRSSPVSVQQQQPPPSQPHPPAKTRRRRNQNSTKTREQLLSENEFLINRVPPVAHVAKGNAPVQHEMAASVTLQQVQTSQSLSQQQQQHNGGSYYENRWNVEQQPIVGGTQSISNQIQSYANQQHLQSPHQHSQQQQTILSHQHPSHTQFNPQSAYYPSYQISPSAPSQIVHQSPTTIVGTSTSSAEAQAQCMLESGAQILAQLASSSEAISAPKEISSTPPVNPDEPSSKVLVPNIEEELEFLAGEPVKVNKSKTTVANINPVLKTTRDEAMQGRTFKVPNSAATGFMASYLKFLQGERDGSPPPLGKTQRKSFYHQKITQTTAAAVINSAQTNSKNLPTATVQPNKTAEQSGSLPTLTITQIGLPTSLNRMQQQNRTSIQQITSGTCPEQPILATALTAAPSSSTTIIANYASTQPINKKRKAVALATEIEQNKQKKINNKAKNVTETAVQTMSHPVMLPKKARPQMAMQMASMQQTLNKPVNVVHSTESIVIKQEPQQTIITTPGTVSQSQDPFTYQYIQKQVQHQQQQDPQQQQQQQQQQQAQKQIHQRSDEDPLNLPPRRETSLRKAKTRGIEEIMQKSFENDDVEEPQEFVDSDTDPVWTPEDEENELSKTGKTIKRKGKKTKTSYSRSRKVFSNILTAAVMGAGIDDSDTDINAAAAAATANDVKVERIQVIATENSRKQIHSPKGLKQEAIKQEASPVPVSTTKVVADFKTGDFVIVRADLIKDWPVIWQVDGKQILQMFEPFHKDGQILYKNMSKYAAWNNESKRLYVRAPVKIRSQSQNEVILELNKSELYGSDIEQFAQKLLGEYLKYRENFDVYIQTLISQSLDRNFFTEITKEKDEYFLSNIKVIDDIMENCKKKLQLITPLSKQILASLETWPHFNVMVDSNHSGRSQNLICSSCRFGGYVRFLLYGQPYNPVTMVQVELDPNVHFEKDLIFCQSCESRIKRLHKITHEKYNLYQICLRKVQEQQLIDPTKGTTAILNDLLAESEWIDQLFANVRNAWAEIECLDKIVRFYQVSSQ